MSNSGHDIFRPLIKKTAVGAVLLSSFIVALGYFFHDAVTTGATQVIDTLGGFGVFVGVVASDVFGVPVPPSTYIFAAVAAESPTTLILLIAVITSFLGGPMAYVVGPYLGKLPVLHGQLERFRDRGEGLFERWGIWAVGAAAITPIPYALCCWLAGIYRMPFGPFFAATLIRAPRLLVYYGLFVLGWAGATVL